MEVGEEQEKEGERKGKERKEEKNLKPKKLVKPSTREQNKNEALNFKWKISANIFWASRVFEKLEIAC